MAAASGYRGQADVDLFEHQAKELFAEYGVPVPTGKVAYTAEEARGIELHLQLIRFGRNVCRAPRPRCWQCPLRRMCPHPEKWLVPPPG